MEGQDKSVYYQQTLGKNLHLLILLILIIMLSSTIKRENSLPPSRIYTTNAFVLFKMMHRFLLENLKTEIDKPALKLELSHFANSYVHNYKPSRSTLRKHGILKKLKNNKSIVILRPDKGNGVVVLD